MLFGLVGEMAAKGRLCSAANSSESDTAPLPAWKKAQSVVKSPGTTEYLTREDCIPHIVSIMGNIAILIICETDPVMAERNADPLLGSY